MVQSGASSNASPETRGLKPGRGSLCRAGVPLSRILDGELQTVPSKGTGTSLEPEGLQMFGKSPSWTRADSSFLFIRCVSAGLPPNRPWGRAAELRNAKSGTPGLKFSLPNHPLPPGQPCALCPSWHRAPTSDRFRFLSLSRLGTGILPAGLGTQREAEGEICPQFGRVNRGASLGKKQVLIDMSLKAEEKAEIPLDFPGALIHRDHVNSTGSLRWLFFSPAMYLHKPARDLTLCPLSSKRAIFNYFYILWRWGRVNKK